MRVLLVEDDYAVSQSIETMLKKEGMIVDTTDLGEDGLEIGKLYDYDIIILDLMLPDMNGYEVLKSLRAKVCAYLLNESERAGSLTFSIPFSRVQLTDYLNCDRSALSRELSLMQKDGLLDTFKSSFKLLDPDALKQMVQ